mgnify:CR=1 FL=1
MKKNRSTQCYETKDVIHIHAKKKWKALRILKKGCIALIYLALVH